MRYCPTYLFNLHIDNIIRYLQDIHRAEVVGHGVNISHYADDTVLMAAGKMWLKEMLDVIAMETQGKCLGLSSGKTEIMVFTKKQHIPRCSNVVNVGLA